MKKRNLEYENKFKSYLFKGDWERFKAICKELEILNYLENLKNECCENYEEFLEGLK